MKSRELHTIYSINITNYKIIKIGGTNDKFYHSFNPKSSNKIYKFIANETPELINNETYNIGFYKLNGENIVDISSISQNISTSPTLSYNCAKQISKERHKINKLKNDKRVNYAKNHTEANEYYWGKKYAWREFGLAISKSAFHNYLKEIGHPIIECKCTSNNFVSLSIAYKEDNLENAIFNLIKTAKMVTKSLYLSPLYSKKFSIKGISAITDKK